MLLILLHAREYKGLQHKGYRPIKTYIPLPTLQMRSDTTKNICGSIVTRFQIIVPASDQTAEKLYSCVDLHMVDVTAHNKDAAIEVADYLSREGPNGQLLFNPHTGYDSCIKKIINSVKQKMEMNNLTSCFC